MIFRLGSFADRSPRGLIVLGAFVFLQCYRRVMAEYVRSSIREEVMLEVKHQMTDYAPLRD